MAPRDEVRISKEALQAVIQADWQRNHNNELVIDRKALDAIEPKLSKKLRQTGQIVFDGNSVRLTDAALETQIQSQIQATADAAIETLAAKSEAFALHDGKVFLQANALDAPTLTALERANYQGLAAAPTTVNQTLSFQTSINTNNLWYEVTDPALAARMSERLTQEAVQAREALLANPEVFGVYKIPAGFKTAFPSDRTYEVQIIDAEGYINEISALQRVGALRRSEVIDPELTAAMIHAKQQPVINELMAVAGSSFS